MRQNKALEYPSCARSLWCPESICFDAFVGHDDELSHQHGDGDFGGFSGGAEGHVLCFEVWIEAHGNEGGHVEGLSEVMSAALNERLAGPGSGLPGHRGEACEAGGLFAVQGADFGHFDQDRCGADSADSGDRADDLACAGCRFFCGDAGCDLGVDVGQLLAVEGQPGPTLCHDEADRLGLQPVTKGGSGL